MRTLPLAFSVVLACTSSVLAGPADEAMQVMKKWTDAFAASDVDAITALYATDALFMGTEARWS